MKLLVCWESFSASATEKRCYSTNHPPPRKSPGEKAWSLCFTSDIIRHHTHSPACWHTSMVLKGSNLEKRQPLPGRFETCRYSVSDPSTLKKLFLRIFYTYVREQPSGISEEALICTDLCFATRLHPVIRPEGEVSLYEDHILPYLYITPHRAPKRNIFWRTGVQLMVLLEPSSPTTQHTSKRTAWR